MIGYRVELAPDDNDTLLVTCPALPEATTFGRDEPNALAHAAEAIEEALAARIASGRSVPPADERGPFYVELPLQSALKVSLYQLLKAQGLTRAELQRRLGVHREQVDRLFRLDHASKLDQLEAAFEALNHRVELRVTEAA